MIINGRSFEIARDRGNGFRGQYSFTEIRTLEIESMLYLYKISNSFNYVIDS